MKEESKGIRHFCNAFGYSMSWLRFAFREPAIRQELLLGIVNCVVLVIFNLPIWSRIVLFALWFLVFVVELLNTAIEAVVDLVSPQFNELAKKAKDLGSAAIFCSLLLFFGGWTAICFEMFLV